MRISGIEPSFVILGKESGWKIMPKSAEEAKAKRDGVINPQNYNFYQF